MGCPSCGSRGADGARFCDQCGTPLPDPEAGPTHEGFDGPDVETGDRRIVTALFADLVDYVRMLAEHDPEEVRARVMGALVTMAEAIERLEGTREKFIGDAVFAVFGWPTVHDDDAVRASLAALEIRAALHETGDGSEPLEVRIGLATGEVVATAPRPSPDGDLGLTGSAITTAARIQSLARPGEILMDGQTLRAARDRLAVEPRGSVVLRGQSTSVELFGLRGEAGMGSWTPYRPAAHGPLVGRERESAVLLEAIERCRQGGRGETILVVGEAGVGKSRLLAAVEPGARKAGFAWTWTENVSYARGEPYRFTRLFAQTVADESGVDSGTMVRRLVFTEDLGPEVVRRYGGAIAAIARDAEFSGWEAEAPDILTDSEEMTSVLAELASRYVDRLMMTAGPRVVVIDDLHWLDASSVGIVEMLTERAPRYPLLVLAGTRPGPMPPWIGRAAVRRLDLGGLTPSETGQLATLVARAPVDAEGARNIHERTAGNPLFVGETVRAFLEDGTLEWRDGRVALVPTVAPRIPVTLRAVLGARIDALEPDAREVLGVASVIGIRFDASTVEELLGGRQLPGTFQTLVQAALIVPLDDGEWRFAHALIHDAAYAGLLTARRRSLHARLADHLESRRRPAAALVEIAGHWAAAGNAPRALPLLRDAADSAMALGAVAEAAAFWRRAAELAAPGDPEAAARDRALASEADAAAWARREIGGPGSLGSVAPLASTDLGEFA